jgi:Domain of unknown function (DUF4451)
MTVESEEVAGIMVSMQSPLNRPKAVKLPSIKNILERNDIDYTEPRFKCVSSTQTHDWLVSGPYRDLAYKNIIPKNRMKTCLDRLPGIEKFGPISWNSTLAFPISYQKLYAPLQSTLPELINSKRSMEEHARVTKRKLSTIDSADHDSKYGTDSDTQPSTSLRRPQTPKFPQDLYTPRWVRNHGASREGLCEMCKSEKWLQLKDSTYWYHKQ